MSSLGGGGGRRSTNTDNADQRETIQQTTDELELEQHKQETYALQLQQEIDRLKRQHLSDTYDLKQENMRLQANNATLKETDTVSQDAIQELQEKVAKYEQELGKNEIDDGIAQIFADEFKKPQDMADTYYQRIQKQTQIIDRLDTKLSELTHSNGDLSLKLARAKSVADQLALQVIQLTNPNLQQLEEDYAEVEAELDEVSKVKESYELQMIKTAQELDHLALTVAKMKPHYEQYPQLMDTISTQRNAYDNILEKLHALQAERDEFKDKYLDIQSKDVLPMAEYKQTATGYQQQIKELKQKHNEIQSEKQNVVQELQVVTQNMAAMKMKVAELEADNDKLQRCGGRDVNVELLLDLENDFSIFKGDEFEYAENLSRDQLLLWCQHLKVFIKEINHELCMEINNLSERNERLEHYVELKGLPFPSDAEVFMECTYNELPDPLPSMHFVDDLNEYNPTKKQLEEYIDVIFTQWREDEKDVNNMIMNGVEDQMLLNQLENDNKSDDVAITVETLQKQLETAHLRQEETTLELNKKIKELQESNEALSTKVRKEEQHKTVEEKDDKLLLNRLCDTEQYVKQLEDDRKALEFETSLQKESLARQYKYENELVSIDLQESRQRCDDLNKQINSDDLNLLASRFRNEVGDIRRDNSDLKKKHVEEIGDLERDRDELLRELNLLRIKTDRMDINTEEAVLTLQHELGKKNKELLHFEAVASNLSNVKEKLDILEADRNELEKSYRLLQDKLAKEKQIYVREMQRADVRKRELMLKYATAQKDIENIKMRHGIDSDAIITKTELVSIKEEMDGLKMKRVEAVASKMKLLETSSLEIERMRHEIKVLNGYMRRYGNRPSRYSVSSMGSSVPFNGAPHQELLGDNNIMGSAWSYTMGMLSSFGSVFANNEHSDSKQAYVYDENVQVQRSQVSSVGRKSRNHHHNDNHMRYASMAGSYAVNDIQHNRGLSSSLYNVKRERAHNRKQSRHRHRSHRLQNSYNPYPIVSNIRDYGKQRQPSRQDVMLEAEDNGNIRESMDKIFDAFANAQNNINRQSLDVSGVADDGLDLDVFRLDHDQLDDNNNKATIYHSDYMRKPHDENDSFDNIGGGVDDFWGTNMNEDDIDVDNHMHQYSDEDRFGIGDIDLNTL